MYKDRIIVYITIKDNTYLRVIGYEKLDNNNPLDALKQIPIIRKGDGYISDQLAKLQYISQCKVLFPNNGFDDPMMEIHIKVDDTDLEPDFVCSGDIFEEIISHIIKGFINNSTSRYRFAISGLLEYKTITQLH